MKLQSTNTTGNATGHCPFKMGEKIYSQVSLHSGQVTKIEFPSKMLDTSKSTPTEPLPFITISRRMTTRDGKVLVGEERRIASAFTKDADVILDIMRLKMKDYEDSFFRVKETLNKISRGFN